MKVETKITLFIDSNAPAAFRMYSLTWKLLSYNVLIAVRELTCERDKADMLKFHL